MRLYALLCFALSCTCEASRPGLESSSTSQSTESGPFLYAPLSVVSEEPPAVFRASLPANVDEWRRWGPEFPPRAHVEDRLLASDEMRHRFATAVAAALAHGDSVEDVLAAHGAMVRWLEPDECGWLGEWAEREETPEMARAFFWIEFATCAPFSRAGEAQQESEDPFAREDLPARAVFARYAAQLDDEGSLELSPRLVETLRRVLAEETRAGDFPVTHVGVSLLLRFEGGTEAALGLRREFPSAADTMDALFRGETNPEALRLFDAYCRRHRERRECRTGGPRWARPPQLEFQAGAPAAIPLSDEVQRYDFDAMSFVADRPGDRGAVVEELTACAGGETYAQFLCLKQLALIDRASARRIAAALEPGSFAEIRSLRRTLLEDEDAATLGSRLASLGLTSGAHPQAARAVTLLDHLLLEGRALQFDTETGMFPNEHDSLLRRLHALARRSEEMVSSETLFGEDASADEEGPYQLHAWRDGRKWSTEARNLGDWYDVVAVIGMLNALARATESDMRWLSLDTGDQTMIVMAGEEQALLQAIEGGLIEPAPEDEGFEN